jgi:hypothetical protein
MVNQLHPAAARAASEEILRAAAERRLRGANTRSRSRLSRLLAGRRPRPPHARALVRVHPAPHH